MTDNTVVSLNTPRDPLTELIRQGARDLIAQHQNVIVDGKQAIVRNGFLPERTLQTGVGDVEVQIPKVRDRSGNGVKFNSNLIPPYLKRTKSVATLLPLLYLKKISGWQKPEMMLITPSQPSRSTLKPSIQRQPTAW